MKILNEKGISILEVILAAAMFVIFSTGAIIVVVSGYNANRLGIEYTIANQFASEGIEAVKSIKNQAYSNLNTPNASPRGLIRNGSNVWAFDTDGTDDRLTHNSSDDFIRTVKVELVNRDDVPPKGNIVPSGSPDPKTKKVTSTVTWNFNSAKPESMSLVSYLSYWEEPITSLDNGLLAYSDTVNTPTFPKYRIYTNSTNSFTAETNTLAGAIGKNFVVRTSPTKREAIMAYGDNNGTAQVLRVLCYDGSTWSDEWPTPPTIGGTGNTTRRFDVAYETNSGDVLVVYSTNTGTTNEVDYRTKSGSTGCGSGNWTDYPSFDSPGTTGVVTWVTMAWDRRSSSNLIAAIWADASLDLQGAVWSGSVWTQRISAMDTALASSSIQDVEFESLSGDIMVIWNTFAAADTNGMRYMTCPGGVANCTWSIVQTPPTFADNGQNLDISANPLDNQILFASIGLTGTDGDLQVGRWDGDNWANVANVDTTTKAPLAAGTKMVATGWLISGSTVGGIVVYVDNIITGIISYLTMTPCSPTPCNPSWSGTLTANPAPTMGGNQPWNDIQVDPVNQNTLMLTVSNAVNDLFTKRLVMDATPTFTWTDANSGAVVETDLGQNSRNPFSFAYWRNP